MLKKLLVMLMEDVLRLCGFFFLISTVTVLLGLALQLSLTASLHGTMTAWRSFFTGISNGHPALIAALFIIFVFITVDYVLKARKEKATF
ncbi:Uncharacterised protein [Yersinia aldovae]|nr:Uncharacterised protein [Yersinia aldovae]